MLRCELFTTDEAAWRDAARRLHRATIAATAAAPRHLAADCDAAIFVGAAQVDPAAIEPALSAGRHVLVVAEPCLLPESLAALAAAAARQKVLFAVQNPDGYLASRRAIHAQLGGPLGSPELIRTHRWESHAAAETMSPLGLPGPLVGEIEQALWLIGRTPTSVFALEPQRLAQPKKAATHGGRHLQVHLRFEPGMALLDYDDRLPSGAGYRSLSVIGSSGSAQTDDQANAQLLYGGGLPRGAVVGEGVKHLAALLDDFAAAVAAPRRETVEIERWRLAARVAAAVVQSLSSRQAVGVEAGR